VTTLAAGAAGTTTGTNGQRRRVPPLPAWAARSPQPVIGVNPLRGQPRVRDWLLREPLDPADLIAPLLVQPANRDPRDYQNQAGAVSIVDQLACEAQHLRSLGVRAVKLFAYVEDKTPDAAAALDPGNLLVTAIRTVRAAVPDMVIATEVCGCAWTASGECVILHADNTTDAAATMDLMTGMAIMHAEAGADIIGPAAVFDGSVREIRRALNVAGHHPVGITASVIFNSSLFTPYKSTMHTDPGRGDRRGFQIDQTQRGQALDQAERWLAEGADSLLVQPAMMAVDVLALLRGTYRVPLTAFSVSGEHKMLQRDTAAYVEYTRYLRVAGADLVMTYGAPTIATALRSARTSVGEGQA
jgi:porphobilinogen synthase